MLRVDAAIDFPYLSAPNHEGFPVRENHGSMIVLAREPRIHTPRICIVGGCGRMGLPLGIRLAESGALVTLLDRDEERVRAIQAGRMPHFEPAADGMPAQGRRTGQFASILGIEASARSRRYHPRHRHAHRRTLQPRAERRARLLPSVARAHERWPTTDASQHGIARHDGSHLRRSDLPRPAHPSRLLPRPHDRRQRIRRTAHHCRKSSPARARNPHCGRRESLSLCICRSSSCRPSKPSWESCSPIRIATSHSPSPTSSTASPSGMGPISNEFAVRSRAIIHGCKAFRERGWRLALA